MRNRVTVTAVGVLAVVGLAACGTASRDVSIGGQAYHVQSTDQLSSNNGQAWLMDQFKVSRAGAQCMASKLADAGITTADQTTQSSNADKNDAAHAACAGQ